VITKADIKHIRSLKQKKFRDQFNEFIIEGTKLVQEAIAHSPEMIKTIYTSAPFNQKSGSEIKYVEISKKELAQLSTLKNPQPVLAVCQKKEALEVTGKVILALDDVRDPGNMGTILRLAAWFGIRDLIVSTGCADIHNPKVIQASMGGIFHVNVVLHDLESFLEKTTKPVYGALMDGKNIYHEKLPAEAIILMGNEGQGISDKLLKKVNYPISIPKIGKGESLNVAMATGIILSEFARP
jgi:TrmH family RNA methyltransferase